MNTWKQRHAIGQSQLLAILALILIVAVGWLVVSKKQSYSDAPQTLIDDSVPKTIQAAAKKGWIPCPGNCLKLATPGWHHQPVEGHPDTDIWFTFPYAGGWSAYSQHHIGHIIQTHSDRDAEDVGICPICNGTGWVRKENSKSVK